MPDDEDLLDMEIAAKRAEWLRMQQNAEVMRQSLIPPSPPAPVHTQESETPRPERRQSVAATESKVSKGLVAGMVAKEVEALLKIERKALRAELKTLVAAEVAKALKAAFR